MPSHVIRSSRNAHATTTWTSRVGVARRQASVVESTESEMDLPFDGGEVPDLGLMLDKFDELMAQDGDEVLPPQPQATSTSMHARAGVRDHPVRAWTHWRHSRGHSKVTGARDDDRSAQPHPRGV